MRVLLDQNIAPAVARFLSERKPRWDVVHVSGVGLHGASDDAIFFWAQQQGYVVITYDEDFADSRMYPAGSHEGIVRLRVWPTTIENTQAALSRLIDAVAEADWRGSLIVVDQNRIRVRHSARHG